MSSPHEKRRKKEKLNLSLPLSPPPPSPLPSLSILFLTCQHLEHLSVRRHRRRGPGAVRPGHVEVALEELAEPAAGHRGLVAAVDLPNVVALDVADAVQGHEAGEGDLDERGRIMGGERERERGREKEGGTEREEERGREKEREGGRE